MNEPAVRLRYREIGGPKAIAFFTCGKYLELSGFILENFDLAH
jgi:hypothetical protein